MTRRWTPAFFYGFDGGYVLFTGATPEDLCYDTPPPLAPAKVFERRDGTFTVKARGIKGIDLFLYEFDGPAPALIGATCEALFDGDPATTPLQPMAVGTGTERLTIRGTEGPDDIGGFHVANSARGTVKSTDGTRWKVRGHASFDVGEDGVPIGEPSHFQGLRVRQIGHRS